MIISTTELAIIGDVLVGSTSSSSTQQIEAIQTLL